MSEAIPQLFGDDETQVYDHTLRTPAASLGERWPITRALDLGAGVTLISSSLAAGGVWTVGPAMRADDTTMIWLSALDVPFEQSIAAWWVGGPPKSHPIVIARCGAEQPRIVVSG
jgi:hypothetical protein